MDTTPTAAGRGRKQLLSLLVIMTMLATSVLTAAPASAQAPDADGDKIEDSVDNCPDDKNRNQADLDEDGIGNKCDDDLDGDGVDNDDDLAPRNPELATDADGDRIDDEVDNCPDTKNRNQKDLDDDGRGDKCDDDLDGDGVDNDEDVAPRNPELATDADEDRIDDEVDNCVDTKNHNQSDIDDDDIGDKCDDDIDGDDVPNDNDLAPTNPNIGLPVPCETTRTDCFSIGLDQPIIWVGFDGMEPVEIGGAEPVIGINEIAIMFVEVDFSNVVIGPGEMMPLREDDEAPPLARLSVAPCSFVNSVPVSIGEYPNEEEPPDEDPRAIEGTDHIDTVMTVPGKMHSDWIDAPNEPGTVSFNRAIKVDCPEPCMTSLSDCFTAGENQAIGLADTFDSAPIYGVNEIGTLEIEYIIHIDFEEEDFLLREVEDDSNRLTTGASECTFANAVPVTFLDDLGNVLGTASTVIGATFSDPVASDSIAEFISFDTAIEVNCTPCGNLDLSSVDCFAPGNNLVLPVVGTEEFVTLDAFEVEGDYDVAGGAPAPRIVTGAGYVLNLSENFCVFQTEVTITLHALDETAGTTDLGTVTTVLGSSETTLLDTSGVTPTDISFSEEIPVTCDL